MIVSLPRSWTAFAGADRIATGIPREVAAVCKVRSLHETAATIFVFDDDTGIRQDLDLRGTVEEVVRRIDDDVDQSGGVEGDADLECEESVDAHAVAKAAPRPRGRPKLGVVGREVTLLPRHWEWLNLQPGGASVAIRKLVEAAKKANEQSDRVRRAKEITFRFMTAMAGDKAGFEEANRALFAGDVEAFRQHTDSWPEDVRDYALTLSRDVFATSDYGQLA